MYKIKICWDFDECTKFQMICFSLSHITIHTNLHFTSMDTLTVPLIICCYYKTCNCYLSIDYAFSNKHPEKTFATKCWMSYVLYIYSPISSPIIAWLYKYRSTYNNPWCQGPQNSRMRFIFLMKKTLHAQLVALVSVSKSFLIMLCQYYRKFLIKRVM